MTKSKTHWCEDCKFRRWVGDDGLRCVKGHKPRFYIPSSGNPYHDDYGWKRRCLDFEIGNHVLRITPT